MKQYIKQALISYGIMTGRLRVCPDFIIIGAQKCGTTALFIYLIKHPSVAHVYKKEVNFFNWNFRNGLEWYKGHFPTSIYKTCHLLFKNRRLLAGEASTNYLSHPYAARRIAQMLPHTKLIVMLRNPVDRAYSHYHHSVRQGFEPLMFEEALEAEEARLHGEMERMIDDEHYYSANFSRFAYRAMGRYVDQLKPWLESFPREQILVINSEEFLADTAATFTGITRYLGLPDWAPKSFERYHRGRYGAMSSTTRASLATYFAPHNERLYACMGTSFPWD